MLVRKNDVEAIVERHSLDHMASLAESSLTQQGSGDNPATKEGAGAKADKKGPHVSVLKFWRLEKDAGSRQSGKSGKLSKAHSSSSKSRTATSQQHVAFAADVQSVSATSASGRSEAAPPEPELIPAKQLEQEMRRKLSTSG